MTAYVIALFAGTALICAIAYTIRMGCRAIIDLMKLREQLTRDQRNGYKINRSAPGWLEGDK